MNQLTESREQSYETDNLSPPHHTWNKREVKDLAQGYTASKSQLGSECRQSGPKSCAYNHHT